MNWRTTVSYTHLDVYKRQGNDILVKNGGFLSGSATLSGNTTLQSGSVFELT